MMPKKEQKPQIRFKGFTDDWEQRKFKSTVQIERGGSPRPIEDFVTNSENGLNWIKIGDAPSMGKYITKTAEKIKPEGLSKTREVHPGDLILSNSMSFGRPYIMAINGCIHDGWLLIRNDKNLYDLQFLCHLLGSENMLHQYKSFAAGSTVNNLNKDLVGNTTVSFPKKAEQSKLGALFDSLDNLITLHQRKYEKLKNIKKSMLEKMFPQNGNKIPEIRFKGFTDDWEQRKFDELANYKKGPFGSSLTKDIFIPKCENAVKVYEQQNAINKDWQLERYFIPFDYAVKMNSFEVRGGDIIVSCAGTIGESYILPLNAEKGIINQALMRIRVYENIVYKSLFLYLFSNMIDDFSKTHSNGSAIKNIPPFADLKPTTTMLPKKNEQDKLVKFISTIDNLITLHQRKYEKLKNIKKSMLEKMFV